MKFLLDENVSFKVKSKIRDVLGEIYHVSDLELKQTDDHDIWNFSSKNNYTIITFDNDFVELSNLMGYPPKIICLAFNVQRSSVVVSKILENHLRILTFVKNNDEHGVMYIL